MKKITLEKLKKDIKDILNNESLKPLTPRIFRVLLGVDRKILSQWKINKDPRFDAYDTAQDKILANLEWLIARSKHNNITGIIFILRTYDTKYRESIMEVVAPIQINIPKTTKPKIAKRPEK